jgi:DNA invertase Pin-like site-specific DNA recombinase
MPEFQQKQCAANVQDCPKQEEVMSIKLTALYERLSRDDGDDTKDSCSIATQKRILEEFAEKNGLTPYKHWVDDGVSGKDFNRPAFQEMLAEIEKGNIGTVCVKNLDRFGRSYLESGLHREMFRKAGVRFIAVGDNIDSSLGEDDFLPFREVINEFYVREYSKKIKAAFKSRGMNGMPMTSTPPYGYLKDPQDKHKWLVDEEASAIVKRVFQMTLDGLGPYQICVALEAEKVKTPGAYLAEKGAGLHQHHIFENQYHWTSTTVCGILKKREYLGHTVNFKSKKESYKDKRNKYVPESEWIVFENTHEPIIDQVTFDNVQRIRGNIKRRPDGWGYVHPLSGLLRCADCGAKLYVQRICNGKDKPYYTCYNYRRVPVAVECPTPHRIDADKVIELIGTTLRELVKYAKTDKAEFQKHVQETLASQQTDEVKTKKKKLTVCKKRAAELETLFRRIYEDNTLGKLDDKRYNSLSESYSAEQQNLEKEIAELSVSVEQFESGKERAGQFTELVKKYEDFNEITTSMINSFIEKIVVHERDRKHGCADYNQQVDIYFNFIGEFSLPLIEEPKVILSEEEQAAFDKKQATKERLRANYLKRKESGAYQAYREKYEPKRKARMEEKKAALFADGAKLGSTVAVNS